MEWYQIVALVVTPIALALNTWNFVTARRALLRRADREMKELEKRHRAERDLFRRWLEGAGPDQMQGRIAEVRREALARVEAAEAQQRRGSSR